MLGRCSCLCLDATDVGVPTQANGRLEWATCLLERTFRRLFCVHPFVRACQLDCHIRKEDVQGLAIGGAAMLG